MAAATLGMAALLLATMLPAAPAFAFSPSVGAPFACKGSLSRSCSATLPLGTTRAQTARGGVLGVKAVAQEVAQLHAALHSIDPAHVAVIQADAMQWMADAQQLLADAAAAAPAATADAAAAVEDKPGLFGNFVNLIQGCLVGLHTGFKAAGIPGAWGLSIAVFTIFIKGITFPLNYKQMASTMQMQSLQPKLKALQARYANDPQTMNEKTAQLYKDEQVNPLAGCLPTLVQIPIFIGLYRSVLELAKKDMLEESFLWLPSLQGPVGEYNLKTGLPIDATAWLFKGWTDGHPALGWSATAAYISIPIILVITQSISQKLLQPPASDWFALNVPAGLGVYWVINNFLSTSQQWWIRQQFKDMQPASNGPSSSSSSSAVTPIKAMPLREVEGFSASPKMSAEESEEGDDDNSKMSRSALKKQKKAKGKRK